MANWKSTLILNKWENGSLRKFGTILFVSAAFSGCVFWGNSYSTPGELFSDKELFSGFSILNMPREDISLGSRWQQGIGPSDKGLSETDLLITASLKETDFSHSNSFKVRAGIIASLKRLYSLEIGGNISESEVISLGEADIVRVKNFKSLKLASGGYYVWEGIRLKSFTLETHRSHAQSLMAKALNVFPGASISLEENETGRAFLKIKGVNLFVAYRIVGFQIRAPVELDSFRLTDLNVARNIGGEYFLEFKPLNDSQGTQDPIPSSNQDLKKKDQCYAEMVITSYNRIRSSGQPEQMKWNMGCKGRSDTGRYELGYLESQNGILLDELIINVHPPNFQMQDMLEMMYQLLSFSQPKLEGGYWDFLLQRRLFNLTILDNPSAPGLACPQ